MRRAGAERQRISASPWRACIANSRKSALPIFAPISPARSLSPRRKGVRACSRARSSARSPGRRAAIAVSATIRSSFRKAILRPSARWRRQRRTRFRIACAPSRSSWPRFMTIELAAPSPALANARAPSPARGEGSFGVYVHWPFCRAKCPYCDFNSHVRRGGIDEARFLSAYLAELAYFASLAPARSVASVFFGGGTPSLMRVETVAAILEAIAKHWRLEDGAEITLEANPTSVEAARFAGYRAAGVNRLSLGVQALDDTSLKALGRQHTADEALAALDLAKHHFGRVSFDLIYAREGQTARGWRDELSLALRHAADHLSLYQLTIEPGTPFAARHEAGSLRTPNGAEARAQYLLT